MNESALMSSISQGIEPAVELAIRHIRESRQYSFSLVTKIYDTEVNGLCSVALCNVFPPPTSCPYLLPYPRLQDATLSAATRGRVEYVE